jgi:hypothetical protein
MSEEQAALPHPRPSWWPTLEYRPDGGAVLSFPCHPPDEAFEGGWMRRCEPTCMSVDELIAEGAAKDRVTALAMLVVMAEKGLADSPWGRIR